MVENTCVSEKLPGDLTFKQVNSLMADKFMKNEIDGKKLMQMDINKFAEVIGSDLINKYP